MKIETPHLHAYEADHLFKNPIITSRPIDDNDLNKGQGYNVIDRDALTYNDPEFPTLMIVIEGSTDDVRAALIELHDEVNRTPSGDDDTFDYWPASFSAYLDLAIQFDDFTGDPYMTMLNKAIDIWDRHIKDNPYADEIASRPNPEV